MTAEDLIQYYKIKEDSSSIKRVEELASQLDEANEKGDTSKIDIITSELNNIGGYTHVN